MMVNVWLCVMEHIINNGGIIMNKNDAFYIAITIANIAIIISNIIMLKG